MQPLSKRWQVYLPLPPEAENNLFGYHPVLRQILYNRGYSTHETARQFLEAQIAPGADPFLLHGISQAVERICYAIERKEPIAVYGDYDVDGVTATALLTEVLRQFGADVFGYIPNRFEEGYGLNKEALDSLQAGGVRLVITVDCGIRSVAEADHARTLGMDMIITDHHHPGPEMPQVQAVVNPKQAGETYLDKDLAGVGLAYKLAFALMAQLSGGETSALTHFGQEYLDLVALGTVADLAPLVGENRAMVRAGLECIRQPRRQGLMALMGVAGLTARNVNATDISFGLGPRLNAAGRLDSALAALRLLLTQDIFEAGQLAQQLEVQNRERQQITRQIQAHAEEQALAENPDALLIFAAHPDYNPGVVGLAASRLVEQFYRPAIVAHQGEEFTRGSCRSIQEFHITQALDECADLLEHHGGHMAAAGFTVRNENLPLLIERLQEIATEKLGALDLRPVAVADVEIPLHELKPDLLKPLSWLEPTGYGNPQPVFVSRGLKVKSSRAVGKDSSHLKLSVTDGRIIYDAIAFRQGHWSDKMPPAVDLMYTFEVNEFNGRSSLQLNVRDLKPTGAPD